MDGVGRPPIAGDGDPPASRQRGAAPGAADASGRLSRYARTRATASVAALSSARRASRSAISRARSGPLDGARVLICAPSNSIRAQRLPRLRDHGGNRGPIDAAGKQPLHHREPTAGGGPVQQGEVGLVPPIDVAPAGDEHGQTPDGARARRPDRGVVAREVPPIHRRAAIEQERSHAGVVVENRDLQRGLALAAVLAGLLREDLRVGTVLEQKVDHREIVPVDGVDERCRAELVDLVDVSALREDVSDPGQVAAPCGLDQRGLGSRRIGRCGWVRRRIRALQDGRFASVPRERPTAGGRRLGRLYRVVASSCSPRHCRRSVGGRATPSSPAHRLRAWPRRRRLAVAGTAPGGRRAAGFCSSDARECSAIIDRLGVDSGTRRSVLAPAGRRIRVRRPGRRVPRGPAPSRSGILTTESPVVPCGTFRRRGAR